MIENKIRFKYISLTRGKKTKVSLCDYESIVSKKWRAAKWGKRFYAVRSEGRKELSMHRFILGLSPSEKMDVDHINKNPLDNRRENLRFASRSSNLANQEKKKYILGKKTSCKYKGVYISRDHKRKKKWHSQITHNKKLTFLGRFLTKEEAAEAYNKKASELFGEFAHLNTIKKGK